MKLYFFGGPFNRRELDVSDALARMHRLELRVTSLGKDGEQPVPAPWQQVAIYGKRADRPASMRYFLGMADEGEEE